MRQTPNMGNDIIMMLRHAWRVFLSKSTPWYVKLCLAGGLIYIVSPYDLIPEWIPVVGMLDDIALAVLLVAWANSFTLPRKK